MSPFPGASQSYSSEQGVNRAGRNTNDQPAEQQVESYIPSAQNVDHELRGDRVSEGSGKKTDWWRMTYTCFQGVASGIPLYGLVVNVFQGPQDMKAARASGVENSSANVAGGRIASVLGGLPISLLARYTVALP